MDVSDTLTEVYDVLDDLHVRHVPVVDEDGDLVGLITHRDLSKYAMASLEQLPVSSQREALSGIGVGELMAKDPECVGPDLLLEEAANMMLENKFGCLPVTEDRRLVGILTEADFVKYVRDSLAE